MTTEREFLACAANVFGVKPEDVSLETTYESIPAWDSMAHLRLIMEVAARYGVEIPFADVVNVNSLWEFWRRINGRTPQKVVAVDLDNTLWQGVAGEDGRDALVPNVAFQRQLKALKERGVLLVALSKNNFDDVAWFFSTASGMPLNGDDFVLWRVNWQPKAENLLDAARTLNLHPDSFVFVDDNPAERLEMASRLPEVRVAAFPPQLDAYFPKLELTEEDRVKTEEYRAEALRKDYLGDLQVWVKVHEMEPREEPRVCQLSQKANQFNVCTHRYTADTLPRDAQIFTAHAGDRFGDQGLVGYVIVRQAEILDFTMSCRVMGRGVEQCIASAVEEALRGRGVASLAARWRRTPKNAPVENLFESLGFVLVSATGDEKRYRKELSA